MTPSPLVLAALASAAVAGLDPVAVQTMASARGGQYQIVLVEDAQHRRWVIRTPLTPVAGARMDSTGALLRLLARRLPYSVPVPQGYASMGALGRAAVYPFLSGQPLRWSALPARSALAADIGHAIAALHNVDRALYDEAGVPVYEAEEYRTRRLAELDRGAATGHVPNGLLSRWERALEDVSLWRYAPTPIHGDLTGAHVLGAFEDDDALTGRVKGITGWEEAKVADPADDFAALASAAPPDALDTVIEAYAHSRVERPDVHLELRARLAGELRLVSALLSATGSEDGDLVVARSAALRRLDEQTHDRPDLLPPGGAGAVPTGHRLRESPKEVAGETSTPDPGATATPGASAATGVNSSSSAEQTQLIDQPPQTASRAPALGQGTADQDNADQGNADQDNSVRNEVRVPGAQDRAEGGPAAERRQDDGAGSSDTNGGGRAPAVDSDHADSDHGDSRDAGPEDGSRDDGAPNLRGADAGASTRAHGRAGDTGESTDNPAGQGADLDPDSTAPGGTDAVPDSLAAHDDATRRGGTAVGLDDADSDQVTREIPRLNRRDDAT